MSQYKIPEWEINGVKLPFDFDDLDTMERYKKALAQMNKDAKTVIVEGDRAEIIKSHYDIFSKVYDTIFGEGTSEKIFKGKANLRQCFETYDNFVEFVKQCRNRSDNAYNQRMQKYIGKDKRNKRKHK
ncbi:hypothetical protein DWW36_12330 [Erysipelotrichaceae bacterium AF15-26LB]|nr:hypothetical protein [[Clostridium] innocuum]RJV87117.1 hypothetical protein DWW36_12330 [Erysipelotrichaceae bacterium AF15-26LB]